MDKSSKKATSPPLPSIDHNEPRTLDDRELELAREAALEVLRTHTREEAMKIFLEGLVPIEPVKKEKPLAVADEDDEDYVIVDLKDLSISEDA